MKRKHQLDEKSNEEESTSKIRHTRVSEIDLFLKRFAGKQENRYKKESTRQERAMQRD